MTQKHISKKIWLIALPILAGMFLLTSKGASAANLANFKAGYIISDYQMTDYGSMTEGEIQDFLWSKGKCYNTNFSGVGTRVDYFSDSTPPTTWHVSNGHTVCLAEENMRGESAAHIIWQAAQDYRINPKVLIVLIQKETGLITDPIPNSWDYQRTAGYGCPDTAACSEKYYGFKNQIRNAAYLFRIVMDGNSSYYPIGNNYIQYNPNAGCGGSVVYIQNLATSALYRYTPYQPNAGALAAGYGTASCGAYGNRNFYAYFEDWFGDIVDEGFALPDSSEVVEGEYIIKMSLDNATALDLAGGSSANGANIQTYTDNNSGAQRWQIASDNNGSYIIKNSSTGKVLDVAGGSTKNGANVQAYEYNGSCAQKWHIVKNADKSYSVYSACSGRALDVAGGRTGGGSNVQIYRPNNSAAQKWNLVPVRTLSDGEYTISSVTASNKVVDIAGGVNGATNGTNIQIHASNKTEAQKWKLTYGKDGYYTILNPKTGKVLDVIGAGTTDGTNVQLYASNNTCAQKWQIQKNGEGYTIFSACSGLSMSTKNENVQINVRNNSKEQKWSFKFVSPIEEGTYTIQSELKNTMTVDVAGGSGADGANIQLFTSNGSGAQKWKVAINEDGSYTIKNVASGKVLDVAGGRMSDGANIQLYKQNNSCAQKWRIVTNEDRTYTLYSMCSEKVLDVAGGRMSDGANIQLHGYNSSKAQKWKFVVTH
ncbi:RICIN domain-containing protein [Candidatus Saccharibacteria bacterium]|nr:RICIN domain-containing protein [Candidatus Saccharibacteria bacterium]